MKTLKVKFYETKRGQHRSHCSAKTEGVEHLTSKQLEDAIVMLKHSLEFKKDLLEV